MIGSSRNLAKERILELCKDGMTMKDLGGERAVELFDDCHRQRLWLSVNMMRR